MANFEIWISDDEGTRLELLNQTSGFEYHRVLNDVGYFNLNQPVSFNRSLIQRDARIEFWRQTPGGNLSLDFLGLLRFYEYRTDARGVTTVTLAGPDLNHLLKRRHILYDDGETEAEATAEDAGDLLRRLVDENLGASATNTDRDWSGLGLSIESNLTDAQTVSRQFAWRRLLDVMQEVTEASREKGTPLYFSIVPRSTTAFEFIVRADIFGQDRTSVGTQGVLGLEFGNLAEPQLSVDYNNEITHVTAADQAKPSRNTSSASDSTRLNASIFNRIEGFTDARNQEDSNSIGDAAQSAVKSGRPRQKFTGRIVNTVGFIYGRDWRLGDKLAWTYLGKQGVGVVRSVRVSVDSSGNERIDARIETEES